MRYFPLVWAGVWRKPARTVFTLLSIVVAFVLFGILQGVDASVAQTLATSRLDRLFVDPRFGDTLPIADLRQIETVPGVTLVAGRSGLFGYWRNPKNRVFVIMSDERFFAARPELNITGDQLATLRRTPDGIVVGDAIAGRYGWKPGDRIPVTTTETNRDGGAIWTFDVVAIIRDVGNPGQTGYVIGNYDYFDRGRTENQGTVTRFLVRIRDPAQAARISSRIDQLFANSDAPTRTQPEKVSAQSDLNSTFNIGAFTRSVVGAAFFSLLFVTANTMAQSVRERTPELAVLKSIGYSDDGLLALVLSESVLICLAGAMLGLGLARAIMPLAEPQFGPGFAQMPPLVVVDGLGAAVIVALASGLLPAWRARRLVIVDALAGK